MPSKGDWMAIVEVFGILLRVEIAKPKDTRIDRGTLIQGLRSHG
jgi:hypothetical protein